MGSAKTRILYLCHDGKIYGAQNSLRLLVEHLPPEQYDIFVSFSKEGPLRDRLQQLPHVTVLTHHRIQGAKHAIRPWVKRVGDIGSAFFNCSRVFDLVQMIQTHHIDLVHTNSLVSLEGALAARLTGVPHIWHIRESFEEPNPKFQLILGKTFTKILVQHLSNKVLCVSDYVRQQFQPYAQAHPEKYHVLYNAIPDVPEEMVQSLSEKQDSKVLNLIYAGRISDGKRFQDILSALDILKKTWEGPLPFHLNVYGEFICDQFEAYVTQTVRNTHLEDCITFHGYHPNIAPYLPEHDLLLMPSSTEPFGRILLEALVKGVPVLTARSGGPVEIIQEGIHGFFHAPNDPASLAHCLQTIYQHRQDLPAMRSRCMTYARQQFDVRRQIEVVDAIYQKLMRGYSKKIHGPPLPCWDAS